MDKSLINPTLLSEVNFEDIVDSYSKSSKLMCNIPFEEEQDVSLHKSETSYGTFKKPFQKPVKTWMNLTLITKKISYIRNMKTPY